MPITLQQFDLEKLESKRISSIGCCIYCGDAESELSDEHVIPYALGGNTTIFLEACCQTCQRLIQPYEQRVLRGQLSVFRAKIEAPTRNKKDRPTHTELHFVEVDDAGRTIRDLGRRQVPIEEASLAFSVWDLPPARILGESTQYGGHAGRPWTYVQRDAAEKLAADVAKETGSRHVAVKIDDISREDFLRFLVKTAHAYAVSELGMEAFRSVTADLILLRTDDLAEFIGSDRGPPPYDSHPANITELAVGRIGDGPAAGYTAVRIHLYPMLGTPAHIVVVGAPRQDEAQDILSV